MRTPRLKKRLVRADEHHYQPPRHTTIAHQPDQTAPVQHQALTPAQLAAKTEALTKDRIFRLLCFAAMIDTAGTDPLGVATTLATTTFALSSISAISTNTKPAIVTSNTSNTGSTSNIGNAYKIIHLPPTGSSLMGPAYAMAVTRAVGAVIPNTVSYARPPLPSFH